MNDTDDEKLARIDATLKSLGEDVNRRLQSLERWGEDNRERIIRNEAGIASLTLDISKAAATAARASEIASKQNDMIIKLTASLAAQKWLYAIITAMGSVIGYLLAHFHP